MQKSNQHQQFENTCCDHVFAIAEYELAKAISHGPLRSCVNAHVYESENYYFLCSYYEIVALVVKKTGCCYDILRKKRGYNKNSTEHVRKFRIDYETSGYYQWRNFR